MGSLLKAAGYEVIDLGVDVASLQVVDLVRLLDSHGLLLCPCCDAPINTKPENMETFIAASYEFGTNR